MKKDTFSFKQLRNSQRFAIALNDWARTYSSVPQAQKALANLLPLGLPLEIRGTHPYYLTLDETKMSVEAANDILNKTINKPKRITKEKPATTYPAVTIDELFAVAERYNKSYVVALYENSDAVLSEINHALTTGIVKPVFAHEISGTIYRDILEDAKLNACEMENTVKYSGVSPHVATQIEVGAILVSQWGYEQTNVDFYCVVEVSNSMCKLLEMNQKYKATGSMCGETEAGKLLEYRAEPIRKKIKGDYVKIESYAYARLWKGQKMSESHWH